MIELERTLDLPNAKGKVSLHLTGLSFLFFPNDKNSKKTTIRNTNFLLPEIKMD